MEKLLRFHIGEMIHHYEEVYVSDREWKHLSDPYLSNYQNQRRVYRKRIAAIIEEGIRNKALSYIEANHPEILRPDVNVAKVPLDAKDAKGMRNFFYNFMGAKTSDKMVANHIMKLAENEGLTVEMRNNIRSHIETGSTITPQEQGFLDRYYKDINKAHKSNIEYLMDKGIINKEELDGSSVKIKKDIVESLIDRKIKKIEVDNAKIEINEKEIENYIYNYFINNKINDEQLNDFYKKNQLENDYLKNIISIDARWIKMIRQIYESRINVNLTEVNEEIKKKGLSAEDSEKLRNQIISSEKNKILNKFSATHLEKSKRKYLIKFL